MKNFKILLGLLAFNSVTYAQINDSYFIERKESGITRQYKESASAVGQVNGQQAVVISGITEESIKKTDVWVQDATTKKF